MNEATVVLARQAAYPAQRVALLPAALIAAAVGAIVLYGVGFATPSLIHNAAHDVRHSINTPCH